MYILCDIITNASFMPQILRCKKKCPKFEEELRHELYNSPEMKQLNSDNQQLFEYLSNNSGVAISNIDDIDRFWATMMVEVIIHMTFS